MRRDRAARTTTLSAPHVLEALARRHLRGSNIITPKHISPSNLPKLGMAEVPPRDSPDYEPFIEMQDEARNLIGSFIWLQQVYAQCAQPANYLAGAMASPTYGHYSAARHMLMHLLHAPTPLTVGHETITSLLSRAHPSAPHELDVDDGCLKIIADANLATPESGMPMVAANKSFTGAAIMLAGCVVDPISQRQHLASPDAHTSEVVAAGTAVHRAVPIRELLHEALVLQTHPMGLFLDSISTIHVANDEAAAKESVWMIRRAVVIQEAVELEVVRAIKIPESDNAADPLTKYLKHSTWARHMMYLLNARAPAVPMAVHW